MNTTFTPSSSSSLLPLGGRALVLGGGGSAGNAWLIGVVAGLGEGGLDATSADLIVGTSAGATAAAQITGALPTSLLDDIMSAITPARITPRVSAPARDGASVTASHLERTQRIIDASRDGTDMRTRMGAAAIELAAASEGAAARWRETVAARLPHPGWPEQRVQLTAVDAATGAPMVFDSTSGVDLVDAVAASCASGFAYPIDGRLFIDGGYRTNAENADLAAGYAQVLVLAPFGGASRVPAEWGTHLDAQIDVLRASGSRVETIFPDDASRAAFGDNVMSPSTRRPAAQAGYAQGRRTAASLAGFWI